MNDLQTLFTIVFGIYFATTVSTSGRFFPFDTTAAISGDLRAFLRLLLAFFMLNIVPFIYFMWILALLSTLSTSLVQNGTASFGVLLAGLGGFGIYRVFVSIALMRRRGAADQFVFYSSPAELGQSRASAGARYKQPPEDSVPYSPLAVGIGGAGWLGICLGAFWLLTLCSPRGAA